MEINKDQIYIVEDYKFVNFTKLDKEIIGKIRIWRNHPEIRKFMYNSDEISEEEHFNFVNNLKERDDRYYWLVIKDEKPLGVINLVKVNYDNQSAESGFYVLPEFMDSGIGLEFTLKINYFFFSILKCKKILGSVEVNNTNALILNTYLGCRLNSGIFKKNGKDFLELEISSENFLEVYNRKNHARNFLKHIKEFKKRN